MKAETRTVDVTGLSEEAIRAVESVVAVLRPNKRETPSEGIPPKTLDRSLADILAMAERLAQETPPASPADQSALGEALLAKYAKVAE